MGQDMLCGDKALARKFSLNIRTDFDASHAGHNTSKNAIKSIGLWKHEVLPFATQHMGRPSALHA